MNAERLLMLADFLETKVPAGQWDFRTILGGKGEHEIPCGTTACALGWGTRIPELREAGLVLVDLFGRPMDQSTLPMLFVHARTVFGILEAEADYLFNPSEPDFASDDEDSSAYRFDADGYPLLPPSASAADVAARIREFVKIGRQR